MAEMRALSQEPKDAENEREDVLRLLTLMSLSIGRGLDWEPATGSHAIASHYTTTLHKSHLWDVFCGQFTSMAVLLHIGVSSPIVHTRNVENAAARQPVA